MPELPEVHTIARGLERQIVGQTIALVDVKAPRAVHGDPAVFSAALAGRRVASVGRRAKLLLLDFSPPLTLAVHLKMTGRLYVPARDAQPDKHTHIVFHFENVGTPSAPDRLFFHDVRKFGYCRLFAAGELTQWEFYRRLGPEPLELAPAAFPELFAGRTAAIKALLLDQRVIAGVGNIYADESLFRAGIRPDARASTISHARRLALGAALREVLTAAIAACGSSIRDYRDASGNAGAFQNSFQVYGRAGRPCLVCGHTLAAIKVAGRTSTYCGRCQK